MSECRLHSMSSESNWDRTLLPKPSRSQPEGTKSCLRGENDADACRSFTTVEWHDSDRLLARIIHECRREAAETEALRGFSQVRSTQADLRSVEEAEREKPRRTRGSAAAA